MLGATLVSIFSIALIARPISAGNFICGVINILGDEDCKPPATPTLDLPGEPAFLPSNEFNFSWQAVDDPSGVTYKVCVAANSSFAVQTCSEAISETSYAANSLISNENQTKFWRVMAMDGVGNSSGWSDARQLTVDVDDPVVTLGADPTLVGGTTTLSALTGTVKDNNLTHYTLVITDPSSNTAVVSDLDTAEISVDVAHLFDVTGLATGIYTATLTGMDKAGRSGHIDALIEVDNSGPDLAIEGGNIIIKGGSITPEVSAVDSHEVTSHSWVSGPSNPGAIDYDATALEPEFTPIIEGSYLFTLTVNDGLGNSSAETFEFGYKQDLPLLPLPTDPEDKVKDATGSLPTAVSPTSNLTRDPREDTDSDDDDIAQVLGTTASATGGGVASADLAALTPTDSGWKIVGILWYWWLLGIVGVAALWAILRRFFSSNKDQNS